MFARLHLIAFHPALVFLISHDHDACFVVDGVHICVLSPPFVGIFVSSALLGVALSICSNHSYNDLSFVFAFLQV